MGKTLTPKYVVVYHDQSGERHAIWYVKDYGEVTQENLEKWRITLNQSYQPNGFNHRIAKFLGYTPHTDYAYIRLNDPRHPEPIVKTIAPMFEVVEPMKVEA